MTAAAMSIVAGETWKFTIRYLDASGAPAVDMSTATAEVRLADGLGAFAHDDKDTNAGEFYFVVPAATTANFPAARKGVRYQVWITVGATKVCVVREGILNVLDAF